MHQVRQNKHLFLDIEFIYEVPIYDVPFADAYKDSGNRPQLWGQSFFHLAKVHANGASKLVDGNDVRIVAVAFEIDDAVDGQPN